MYNLPQMVQIQMFIIIDTAWCVKHGTYKNIDK
jgi:hypothetical protein